MVGVKRSTRLAAARQSRPTYNELGSEEDECSSNSKESDENEEFDFSEGGGSDVASEPRSPSPPAKTRAVTRKGRLDRQTKLLAVTSTKPPPRKSFKVKAKNKLKAKPTSPTFDLKEKPETSSTTNDDGSDHAEEDVDRVYDRRKEISQKNSEQLRPTSASKECKTSKGRNLKIPPSEDEISKSRNSMVQAKYDATTTPSNAVGDVLGANKGERDGDLPPTLKNAGADEGGRKAVAGNVSRDRATQKYLEPETATDNIYENTPITVDRNDSNPYLNVESPPLASMPGEIPIDTKSPDWSEREARPKKLTAPDTAKRLEDILKKSIRPITDDSEGGKLVDSDDKKSMHATESDNVLSGQTSVGSSMQKDGESKEHQKDEISLAASSEPTNDKKETLSSESTAAAPIEAKTEVIFSSLTKGPATSSGPTNDKKETLSFKGTAAAPIEAKAVVAEVISKGIIHELNRAVAKAEPDESKSGQSTHSHMEIEKHDIQMNAMLECANSRIPTSEHNDLTVEPSDMMSRMVPDGTTLYHHPSQALKEMEGSPSVPSLKNQVWKLPESNRTNVPKTVSTSIQSPKLKRTQQLLSVGQLKTVLFLEASNAHRGNGAERMFANYWETLEKYVTLGSHGAIKRTRSNLTGTEATLKVFLKTQKMKRLHNKLVLAIMREAMRITIPEHCSPQVPQQWQSAAIKSKEEDVSVYDDRKSDLIQWNDIFGPCSGAWTVCGDDLARTKVDARQAICPELFGSFQKGGLEEEEVLPSARLPGALEIEPLVRKHTEKVGLTSSDHAIWMLVVAVREHSSSLIKKVIANDKDFRDGYAPSLPTYSRTSLACNHLTPKDCNGRNKLQKNQSKKSSGKLVKCGKKVINSTSLSHVLVETASVASRLTSSRSLVISDGRGVPSHSPGLDNVNCIINASIQRGASKRQRSSTSNRNVLTKATTASVLDFGPNKQSAKARPSPTQSLPTTLLPLKKPQFRAQTRNISTPTLIPPQYQSNLPSMPLQNIHPPNSAQMMNHSDHRKEIQPFGQQTLPILRAEIPKLEPLTKPGFPGLTNHSQKPKPSKNPAPSIESSPPRAIKRGAKNLATMSSQSNLVGNKGSAASDGKNANGATPDEATISKQNEQKEKQEGGTKDNKDDTKESAPPLTAPSRPKGRGFGVKNLSRMRAKASDSAN